MSRFKINLVGFHEVRFNIMKDLRLVVLKSIDCQKNLTIYGYGGFYDENIL